MVSKNNFQKHQEQLAKRKPHYGIRKLSVGVASVLLSTTMYLGASANAANADTINGDAQTDQTSQPKDGSSLSSSSVTLKSNSSSAIPEQASSEKTNTESTSAEKTVSEQANSEKPNEEQASSAAQSSSSVSPEQTSSEKTNTTVPSSETANEERASSSSVSPEQTSSEKADTTVPSSEQTSSETANTTVPSSETANAELTNKEQATQAVPKRVARSLAATPTNDEATEHTTTLTSKFKWAIHYVDETGKKLLPDSMITHDYIRTDVDDQMGNWSYVPGSVEVTGTPNNGSHIDNPEFKFNQTAGGTTFDFATWQAVAAAINGYTAKYGSVNLTDQLAKKPESLHASTVIDSKTGEFTFVYTKQPTKVTINYVDDEQGEKVVGTGTVSGKSGTEVTITPQLPKDYMLTPNKDVPSTYTVTDADNQVVTIHVQKQFVDLSDTDPQAKQTRTITLHYVYGAGDKQGQKAFGDAVLEVYYHRTATLDRTTNQTTYGDWLWDQSQGDSSTPGYHVVSGKWTNLPQSWASVIADVPSIKGYHADLGQNDPTNINHVPANKWVYPTWNGAGPTGKTLDGHESKAYQTSVRLYEVQPEHTVKYMPNQTTVTVNYVDDDNGKVIVGSQHWDGTTGQHIDLTLTPPDNYVLTPGWVNPTSYDFDGTNSTWYTVHVKHKTQDVTDQQPADQVTKVTRLTRNHLYGDGPHKGEKFGEPDIFDLAWKRTATKDLVTGDVTFGNWQVDWDNSKSVQGKMTARPKLYNGVVDGPLYGGKNGYSYVDYNAHSEFVRADGSVKVNSQYKLGWDGAAELEAYPVLNYYYGPAMVSIGVQYIDQDTGQIVGWKSKSELVRGRDGDTVQVPSDSYFTTLPSKSEFAGYQVIPGQTLPTSYTFDTLHNMPDTKVYISKDRSVKVTFVDDDNKQTTVGTPTTITGRTGGEPVTLNLTVPDKYELADGQQLPTSYTFTKGSGDVVVHLKHQVVTKQLKINTNVFLQRFIKAYSYINNYSDGYSAWITDDEFNDAYAKWKNGDDHDEFILDEFLIGKPTNAGSITGFVQYDLVSGKIVKANNGETLKFGKILLNYPSYDDVVNGGSLSPANLNFDPIKITLTNDLNKDTYENLNYKVYASANLTKDLLTNIKSIIPSFNKNCLLPFTFENGKQYGSDYEINTSSIDNSFSIGFNDLVNNFTSYDIYKNDDGSLSADNYLVMPIAYQPYISKTVTRTINITNPDGIVKTIKQTAKINQNVAEDIDFEAHNGFYIRKDDAYVTDNNWSTYEVPTIDGYTATQSQVDAVEVNKDTTDQTIDISYTANKQSVNVNYVDINDGNKVVHVTTVEGVTDRDATVANELPIGYKFVDGQSIPKTIHFNANNNDDINVKVQHSTVTVTPDSPKTPSDKLPDNPGKSYPSGVAKDDLTKTVTRKATITTPDNKSTVTNQTVTFTRNAIVDEVTGNVTYGSWSENGKHEFVSVNVPTVPGYTATGDVPSLTVTPDSKDTTVTIGYTANDQSTHIIFVDKDGKPVDKVNVNGKTGETVQTNAKVPDGYELVDGQTLPKTITFGDKGSTMTFIVTPIKNDVPSTDKTQPAQPAQPAKPADKQVTRPKVQQKVQPKVKQEVKSNVQQKVEQKVQPKVVKDSSELTELPQTGQSNDDKALTATGLAMIGSLLGMFGLKNKKRKHGEE